MADITEGSDGHGDRAGVSGDGGRHAPSTPAHLSAKHVFEMILGWNSACRGEPRDPHQTAAFYEGYELWLSRPTKKIGLASTEELNGLADQLSSRHQFASS